MRLYFTGNYINKKMFNKNEIILTAGLKWQLNLINSLKKICNPISYTELQLPTFPKINKLILPTKEYRRLNNGESKLINYVNLPFLREIMISIQIFLIFLLKKIKNKKIIVIQYNLNLKFSFSLFILEKIGVIEFIPIVLDFYPLDKNLKFNIRNWFNEINFRVQVYILKNINKCIIINEKIAYDFNLKNYLLIEGGVIQEDYFNGSLMKKKNEKKIIVFTGTMDSINGIDFLIESLKMLKNKEYELHLYGTGPLTEFIEIEAKKNKKIKYMGYKKNEEILKVQREADFLIIPRKKSLLNLRYTFPSKLFEYMLSGTPIICTNIPGLSEEYKENLFIADTEDKAEFARVIDEVLKINEDKLEEKGKKAKEFIIKNKNWDIQAKKIIDFLYKK